jgi:uncharacterized membrane protein YdjX (TVP38/TMEM64 family)
MQRNGLRIMILLRLSPLIPFNALDYCSGATAISLLDYSLALLAMIPGVFVFCSVGATASSLVDIAQHDGSAETDKPDGNRALQTCTLVVGIIFALAGIIVASYYAKEELNKVRLEMFRCFGSFPFFELESLADTIVVSRKDCSRRQWHCHRQLSSFWH